MNTQPRPRHSREGKNLPFILHSLFTACIPHTLEHPSVRPPPLSETHPTRRKPIWPQPNSHTKQAHQWITHTPSIPPTYSHAPHTRHARTRPCHARTHSRHSCTPTRASFPRRRESSGSRPPCVPPRNRKRNRPLNLVWAAFGVRHGASCSSSLLVVRRVADQLVDELRRGKRARLRPLVWAELDDVEPNDASPLCDHTQ